MTETTTANDLDWLAFCYVHDELDAEARGAFEHRLNHDQAAREAVAQAVSLSAALLDPGVAPQRPESTHRPTGRRWASAVACGALAASVAAVITLRGPQPRHSAQDPAATAATDVEVALVWEELQQSETWSSELSNAESNLETPAEDFEANASVDDAEDLAAPAWLMEAVQDDPAILDS